MRIRPLLWPVLIALLGFAAPARATTFTVNVTDDTNDGTCNAAHCSLREALQAAQAAGGAPHTIAFNIPGGGVKTINVLLANGNLALINQSVTIDGFTQPGSVPNTNASGAINAVPLIEVHGVGLASGLQVFDPGPGITVVIRGLVVNGFTGGEIFQNGGILTVQGCFIGTTADGLAAVAANASATGVGVTINTLHVGGLAPADRNVISGLSTGISGGVNFANVLITVQGNLVGTSKSGTAAVANQTGYRSSGAGGGNVASQIGGATLPARNVFSGNTGTGINISNGGVGTTSTAINSFIKGNLIGTDATGTSPIPNGIGVEVTNGPNFSVGGLAAGEGNTIAFNSGAGVFLQSSIDGLSVLSNSIHDNGGLGIDIDGFGATANDPGDADFNRPNFPVVTAIARGAGSTTVQGTFDAPTTGTYRLQMFRNVLPDASSHGEGQTLVGQITPVVGATGSQPFSITVPVAIPDSEFIAFTLTDPGNNTSEFSEFIADLSLTETDVPDPAFQGQQVTNTFTVTNSAASLFPSAPVNVVYSINSSGQATFVSASGGATPVGSQVTMPVGALVPGQSATRTVVVTYSGLGTFQSSVTATTRVTDPTPVGEQFFTTFVQAGVPVTFTISGQVRDLNDTGVPSVTMTLSGSQNGTLTTDADGHYAFTGLAQGGTYTVTPTASTFTFTPPSQTFPNLQANQVAGFFVARTGTFARYFAEGATGAFFDTFIALFNATGQPTTVTVKFQKDNGQVISKTVTLAGLARATIVPETLPGLEAASFSTVIESTQPIIADRTMRWDDAGYGSHAETSVAAPLTTWYLAEGATTGGFNLFYLIQNPTAQPAAVQVQYLRPAPAAPIVKTYTVNANTRRTIYVNGEDPLLDEAEIAAVITSTNAVPIVVERAMYLDANGQLFGAGHESAAVPDLSTSWFFAEGATGPFFNMFLLVANPGDVDASLEFQYLLPSGQVITRTHVARAHSRLTIGVHEEDLGLARAAVSTTLRSTNGVPVLAERAMWWPAIGLAAQWQEGHNSAGAVRTGEKWGLAEGEEGGPLSQQTFVLVANTSDTAGSVEVTVVFEDGSTAHLASPMALAAHSRTTLPMGTIFPSVRGKRFATIVESLGPNPAQIVVERAMYNDAVINGQTVVWAAGSNAIATRLR